MVPVAPIITGVTCIFTFRLLLLLLLLLLLFYLSDEAMDLTIRGSIPGRKQQILLFSERSRKTPGPIQLPIQWEPAVLSLVLSSGNVTLTTYLNLVLRLWMSGTILLLPSCAFMSFTGITLSLSVVFKTCSVIHVDT
jgi:hypothetical protein